MAVAAWMASRFLHQFYTLTRCGRVAADLENKIESGCPLDTSKSPGTEPVGADGMAATAPAEVKELTSIGSSNAAAT